MRNYRCVFSYAGGHTTIDVQAEDGDGAAQAAARAINAGDYDRLEIWDGPELVVSRTTPRAWDALGETPSADGAEPPTLPASENRVPPSRFALGLRTIGLDAARARWKQAISRKG